MDTPFYDPLHLGAGKVAERVLGADTPENRAIIFRWQANPASKPPWLIKVGRHLAAWESQIRRHAEETVAHSQNTPAASAQP